MSGERIKASCALSKIFGTAFGAFALLAFGYVLDLPVFKQSLHFDFSAAITEELLGCTGGTRVFTFSGLSHGFLLAGNPAAFL